MKLSFVIPCYRSERTLPAVVAELKSTMAQRPEVDYEIILTEDGSPDGVWQVIRSLAEADRRIRAIRFTRNFGQHAALMAGLSAVSGDAAFLLDDDGQAPVDELFKLVDELEKGYDVVYGAYPEIRQNAFRRFGTWANKLMAESLLDWPTSPIPISRVSSSAQPRTSGMSWCTSATAPRAAPATRSAS